MISTQPSREPKTASREPQFMAVGKVLRPQGVRGELRLEIHTGYPGHLADVDTVYIGESHLPRRLQSSRQHQKTLLIKIEGCDDRTQADALRGQLISVAATDAVALKPGQFFHHQIIGLNVVGDDGELLGVVSEILQTGSNDVYVVKNSTGELLLPAIQSVILKIEPPQITVHLIEGLR